MHTKAEKNRLASFIYPCRDRLIFYVFVYKLKEQSAETWQIRENRRSIENEERAKEREKTAEMHIVIYIYKYIEGERTGDEMEEPKHDR